MGALSSTLIGNSSESKVDDSNSDGSNEPFSFKELFESEESSSKPLPDPVFVDATDGVNLAIRIFRPDKKKTPGKDEDEAELALVFYHGGGAHSGAGYQHMADGLASDYGITVYLPDIRGHGKSGGPRGDAPSPEQVWKDVDTVLDFVGKDLTETATATATTSVYLGGHSSGGGLVVNYAAWDGKSQALSSSSSSLDIAGHVLVAPQLGHNSGTARPPTPGRPAFASVSVLAFIVNAIFGVLGHYPAVRFAYPTYVLEGDEGLVAQNTVSMANAISPEDPGERIRNHMSSSSTSSATTSTTVSPERPMGLWIGSEDELFVAEKVAEFGSTAGESVSEIVPGQTHLGILVRIHEQIGPWLTRKG